MESPIGVGATRPLMGDAVSQSQARMNPNQHNRDTSDREIVSTRVFDAPREVVFRAWSDAKHLARWWGPKGFTNTFEEFDFRVGGMWRFVMHGPNRVDYPNESVFLEVDKPERIVFQHISEPHFKATITFEEQGEKTLLTWRMLFDSAEEYNRVKVYAVPGNLENLDKLEVELARMD